MARLANSKVISVDENGVLHFLEDGDYTIDFKRFVQIFLEDGQTTNIDPDEFAGLSIAAEDANKITYADAPDRIDLSGIAFIGADESGTGGAETSVNIDDFLARLLQDQDAGSLAQVLTIDGSQATAFEVLWEYLDDGYVDEGYFASVNENFVRLGIAYLDYLEDGGAPLTDSVGKFAPDGPDADLVPERLQSLHDNLLGNLIGSVIDGRFDPALAAELKDAISAINPAVLDRPYYSGNDTAEAAYDAVRAFDYEQAWDRTDYVDQFLGAVDDRASNGGAGVEMIFGDGNSTVNYAISQHEGAGVELALKAKIRSVGDYDDDRVIDNGDGTYTYVVDTGEGAPNRATWNIDWAATVTEAGDNEDGLSFRFLLDIDPTDAEDYVDLTDTGREYAADGLGPLDLQNSWNYGFFGAGFDPDAEGEYAAKLEAYDDGELIAEQIIFVQADDPLT